MDNKSTPTNNKSTGGQSAPAADRTAAAPASTTPPATQGDKASESDEKPDAVEKPDAETTGYEVAPGRTVGGKGPGETVELNDDDALRFFKLGFILDEDGNRAGFSDGPKTAAGIEIKEV